MEIIFHAHHAAISPRLRQRADTSIRKIIARLGRAVDAVVRVEEDGPTRRVELVLYAARGRRLVAHGEGRAFGPALTVALGRLGAQVAHAKRARRSPAARRHVAKASARQKLANA
jgi:ribosome-associated translation inhibitor RaiA